MNRGANRARAGSQSSIRRNGRRPLARGLGSSTSAGHRDVAEMLVRGDPFNELRGGGDAVAPARCLRAAEVACVTSIACTKRFTATYSRFQGL